MGDVNCEMAAYAQAAEELAMGPIRVLFVDDDRDVLLAAQRTLERGGYSVTTASDGEQAVEVFAAGDFDLVVSDIDLPRLDGIGVLNKVRTIADDVPVILITGSPRVDVAIAALNLGPVRFLTKPLEREQLLQAVRRAVGNRRLDRLQRGVSEALAKRARAHAEDRARFESALSQVYMAFQPVVHLPTRSINGHEALARTRDESVPYPGALFALTERLGEVAQLGRKIRAECAQAVPNAPAGSLLFVNLHSAELLDADLVDKAAPLTAVAQRVVLEIAERASMTDLKEAPKRIAELRALGFRIAIDDIGAGYAGLNSFALLEPDIVKIDMALVRDVDQSLIKRRLIAWFVELCKTMDVSVIAEGVETDAELQTLVTLGCELFQGYLFAKPAARFWTTLS